MEKKITVALTEHRIEMLELLGEEARKNQLLILEEPKNEGFSQFLEGEKDGEDYVSQLNTTFPLFTLKQLNLLREELHDEGIEIVQIEPYYQNLEKIHEALERGKLGELKGKEIDIVKRVEKKVTYSWLMYQEEFANQNFDEIVKRVIFFAQADALRFRVRDFTRAKHIVKFLEISEKLTILIEAGRMHFLLPKILGNFVKDSIATIDLVEKKAKLCNLQLFKKPGDLLTEGYITGEKINEEKAKLMAARSLIYVSLIEKKELLPTDENPCPHLKDENEIAKYANNLSYNQCEKEFKHIWKFK